MTESDGMVRITGEGELSFKLLDISIESDGFIGSSAVIAHRPGISDELVYHYMYARELMKARSAIIFPLEQPSTLPIDPQPEILDFKKGSSFQLQPGKSYRFKSQSELQSAKMIERVRKAILPRSPNDFPIIFVLDTLQTLSEPLEKELRILIRESPMNHISVWLHCPLTSVPRDLLPVIGNVAVIWPSKSEFDILKENLSTDRFVDIDGASHPRGMLFISNIVTSDGKGWQFSELQYENVKLIKGLIYATDRK